MRVGASASSASRTPGSSSRPACSRGPSQLVLVSPSHDDAVGRDPDARRRPRALRPALRGPRPGRRGLDPRRVGRSARPGGERPLDHPPASDRWRRRPGARGRRRHLRDRVRGAPARPAGPGPRDVRREPAAGGHAVVGERHDARRVRGGDARPGVQGPPAARRPGQLRGGPWRAVQRAGPRRAHRRGPRFGIEPERRGHRARAVAVSFVAGELAEAPDLFHQRGYLARVLAADPGGGWRDDGVQPLAHVLDATGPDARGVHARGGRERARSTRSCSPATAGR